MARFFKHFQKMNELLDQHKLIDPYIPKESRVHLFCPYRNICERGQDALILNKNKRKNIPLWMIYQIRRKKQSLVVQGDAVKKVTQLKLFE
jgi:hypothetical protein